MTPTLNQHHAYSVKRALDISLPESLKNKDLLDENSYAFEEIAALKDATKTMEQVRGLLNTSVFEPIIENAELLLTKINK